jgi:hypothetical protein
VNRPQEHNRESGIENIELRLHLCREETEDGRPYKQQITRVRPVFGWLRGNGGETWPEQRRAHINRKPSRERGWAFPVCAGVAVVNFSDPEVTHRMMVILCTFILAFPAMFIEAVREIRNHRRMERRVMETMRHAAPPAPSGGPISCRLAKLFWPYRNRTVS